MITGIGIDLVEIPRIRHNWERFGLAFASKILHEDELAVLPANPAAFLAARFAAKEAAVKALGTGFTQGIWFQHFCVRNLPGGQPQLSLYGAALRRFNELGAAHCHLSLTHGRESAAAVVILES